MKKVEINRKFATEFLKILISFSPPYYSKSWTKIKQGYWSYKIFEKRLIWEIVISLGCDHFRTMPLVWTAQVNIWTSVWVIHLSQIYVTLILYIFTTYQVCYVFYTTFSLSPFPLVLESRTKYMQSRQCCKLSINTQKKCNNAYIVCNCSTVLKTGVIEKVV